MPEYAWIGLVVFSSVLWGGAALLAYFAGIGKGGVSSDEFWKSRAERAQKDHEKLIAEVKAEAIRGANDAFDQGFRQGYDRAIDRIQDLASEPKTFYPVLIRQGFERDVVHEGPKGDSIP